MIPDYPSVVDLSMVLCSFWVYHYCCYNVRGTFSGKPKMDTATQNGH